MRHTAQFFEPFTGIIAILVLTKAWRSQRVVDDFSIGVKWIFTHQPIIFTRDFAYGLRPLKLVELCSRRLGDVIRRQEMGVGVVSVEHHQT